MPLKPLAVVARALETCPPPSFDWGDEEDADSAIGEINEDYTEEFREINPTAALAYVLAANEWIYWYVREHLDPEDARDYYEYLAAHWVWICQVPRKVPPGPYEMRDDSNPPNPVFDMAMFSAIECVANGIYSLPDDATAVDAAYVTQLCEYVFPKECRFDEWRTAVFERLKNHFPTGAESYKRVRIPRRLFDTDAKDDIDPAADCEAVLAEAASLADNRYLPLHEPD
jgi:hypothetical protein